jgi:hypothetical protein
MVGKSAGTLLCVLMLSGASCSTRPSPTPYQFTCPAICYQDCVPLTDWTGDKDDEYLAWIFERNSDEDKQCNAQRGTCAQCLIALKSAHVIDDRL